MVAATEKTKNEADLQAELAKYIQTDDVSDLAAFVYERFTKAITTRRLITERMRAAIYAGQLMYEPGRCPPEDPDAYFGVSAKKCRQVESWLRSVLGAAASNLWVAEPTTRPDLPEDTNKLIYTRLMEEAQKYGVPPEELMQMESAMRALAEKHLYKLAKDNTNRMSKYIADLLDDSNFASEFDKFLVTLAHMPFAVMEGPYIKAEPAITYQNKAVDTGGVTIATKATVAVRNLDPLTVYWSSDCTTLQNGTCVILDEIVSTNDLLDAIDANLPGFIPEAVGKACDINRTFNHGTVPTDAYLTFIQKDEPFMYGNLGMRRCLKYHGLVPGKMLSPVVQKPLRDNRLYEAEIWVVDGVAVKVALCVNPLGTRAFFAASLYSSTNAVVGKGIVDVLHSVERICNTAMRNTMRNMPYISGPMGEVTKSRIVTPDNQESVLLEPHRLLEVEPDPIDPSTPAVHMYTIPNSIHDLDAILEKYASRADELSGVPPHITGNIDVASMARTASGMSMILKAAGLVLQNAVANIDARILTPMVTSLYNWVMLYHPDPSIKADAKVKAKGVSGVINKDVGQLHLQELLTLISPYAQAQLVPPTLLVTLLREIVSGYGYDADALIPQDTATQAIQFQNQLLLARGNAEPSKGPDLVSSPDMAAVGSGLPAGDGRFVR